MHLAVLFSRDPSIPSPWASKEILKMVMLPLHFLPPCIPPTSSPHCRPSVPYILRSSQRLKDLKAFKSLVTSWNVERSCVVSFIIIYLMHFITGAARFCF